MPPNKSPISIFDEDISLMEMNKRKRIIHSDFSRVLANRLESKEKEVTDKNAIRVSTLDRHSLHMHD